MFANSRVVAAAQDGPHPDLARHVRRHLAQPWRKPIAAHTRAAYARALAARPSGVPLVLDAGCGTGAAALALAHAQPQDYVIGVDRSAHRLARAPRPPPANLHLARADLADFWRLLAHDGVRLAAHYLLYPNPWPKRAHLRRRWPAHPVFPTLLALGGRLELRCNWRPYAEEFALALRLIGGPAVPVEPFVPATPLGAFERKYQASDHTLWRCVAQLS